MSGDPSTREGWIQLVAQKARERRASGHPPPQPRPSLVVGLAGRVRDLYQEVGELTHRLREVEDEAAYLRDSAAHADAWLDQLRREGRVPQYPPGEIERLHDELDAQAERIAYLEDELQKKSDVIGDMLQKMEGAEDARKEAAGRYKGLKKQQERIAAAFQEQTRRVRALKSENEALRAQLEKGDGGPLPPRTPAALSSEAGPAVDADALNEAKTNLMQARGEAEAAKNLLRTTQSQLQTVEGRLKRAEADKARLERERNDALTKASASQRTRFNQEGDVDKIRTRLGVAEARVLEIELELNEAKAFQAKLKGDRNRAEGQVRELKQELEGLRSQKSAAEAAAGQRSDTERHLQGRLSAAEGLTTQLGAQLEETRRQIADLKEEASRNQSLLAETRTQRDEAQDKRSALASQLDDIQKANTALQDQLTAALEGKHAATAQVKTLEALVEAAEAKISQIGEALTQAQAQVRELEAARDDAENQRDAARAAEATAQIALKEGEARAQTQAQAIERLDHRVQELKAEARRHQQAAEAAEDKAAEALARIEAAEAGHKVAQAQAKAAEAAAVTAKAEAGEAALKRREAVEAADEARARLRGAEAHRKTLEARLAEEAGAAEELATLKPQLEAAEGDRRALSARLEEEEAHRADLTAELSSIKGTLESQRTAIETLEADVTDGRNRAITLREDLRKARLAISELTEERDSALALSKAMEAEAQGIGDERSSWGQTRGQLQAEVDRLQDELARLRSQAELGARAQGVPASSTPQPTPQVSATGRRAMPPGQPPRFFDDDAPLPPEAGPVAPLPPLRPEEPVFLSDLAPRPGIREQIPPKPPEATPPDGDAPLEEEEAVTLSPEPPEDLPTHTLPPRPARRWGAPTAPNPQGPVSVDDWEPKQAPIPDEPYAPVSLESAEERGISDPHAPLTGSWSTSARNTVSRRSTATQRGTSTSRRGPSSARRGTDRRAPDDPWQSLVAKGKFRSRGVIGEQSDDAQPQRPQAIWEVPSPKPEVELTDPNWDRPIVNLEAEGPRPNYRVSPDAAEPIEVDSELTSELPSVEMIREALSAGLTREAFRQARTLWRRSPGDPERMTLFLEASRSRPQGLMEALAELDERMAPKAVSAEEARVISHCLIEQNMPSEAVPYVLWPLSHMGSPATHPLVNEGAQALGLLRDRGDGSHKTASLLATLNTLPLPCLAPIFFKMEGFTINAPTSPQHRPTDFELASGASLPGADLSRDQVVRVRSLAAVGSFIEPEIFDDFDTLNPQEAGVKIRVSFAVVPQPVDAKVIKELRRLRRKKKHLIIPLSRTQMVDAILEGNGPATLKAVIKSVR